MRFETAEAAAARIDGIVASIRQKTAAQPTIGLVLGSGLGDYAERIEDPTFLPYRDIPGFPHSTAPGHAGRFVVGTLQGRTVMAMQGRFHFYEGWTLQEVTLPVRVMQQLGVRHLVLTNAAGGVNRSFDAGTLMLLSDHINFAGQNPLMGPNLDDLGPRFPDMSAVYDPDFRAALRQKAEGAGIPLEEGVYMMFSGPSFETPAEVRMAGILGADAVGMSTVPEAIVARHSGMRVVGISCITNKAAGIAQHTLSHNDVVETAARVKERFTALLDLLVGEVLPG